MSNSMHDTTTTSAPVRNRPAWSDPARDREDREESTHLDDRGVWLYATVDAWTAEEEQDGRVWTKKVLVELRGFRHDTDAGTGADWPDSVHVDIESDDGCGSQLNNMRDVRRLAAALATAADRLSGPVSHSWISPRGQYRSTEDGRIESYQAHADEWRTCADLRSSGGRMHVLPEMLRTAGLREAEERA